MSKLQKTLGGGRTDSGSDVMRSTSSTNMANMTQSMYSTSSGTRGPHGAEHQNFPSNHQRRSSEREMNGGAKRATSVHALDQSAEIDGKYTILHIPLLKLQVRCCS